MAKKGRRNRQSHKFETISEFDSAMRRLAHVPKDAVDKMLAKQLLEKKGKKKASGKG